MYKNTLKTLAVALLVTFAFGYYGLYKSKKLDKLIASSNMESIVSEIADPPKSERLWRNPEFIAAWVDFENAKDAFLADTNSVTLANLLAKKNYLDNNFDVEEELKNAWPMSSAICMAACYYNYGECMDAEPVSIRRFQICTLNYHDCLGICSHSPSISGKHQYDTSGYENEYDIYDEEPQFVTIAEKNKFKVIIQ